MLGSGVAEHRRLAITASIGGAVGVLLGFVAPWGVAAVTAWDLTAGLLMGWIWLVVGRMNAGQTGEFATREDSSREATRVLLLLASVTSLTGVLYALIAASDRSGAPKAAFTVLGIATVVISWVLVHTLFTLRYAHLYYSAMPGGIDFKNDSEPPAYADFAYVAFTIGMTFQVSDTDIQSAEIRRTALKQSLLAYLFGTVIVATTINIVAGLLK